MSNQTSDNNKRIATNTLPLYFNVLYYNCYIRADSVRMIIKNTIYASCGRFVLLRYLCYVKKHGLQFIILIISLWQI